MDAVAVIPARGGSKRIPGKNIRLFAGKPMIAHSILAAKRSNCFSRIFVSTDSEEVARIAREWGAEVPSLRPAHLADDHATATDVLRHELAALCTDQENCTFACCIFATAPLLQSHHIGEGYARIQAEGASIVASVAAYAHPVQRALCLDGEGALRFVQAEHTSTRTQDLPQTYHDAAQFYWVRVADFLRSGESLLSGARPVHVPRKFVCDIDTEEDWELAEAMYKTIHAPNPIKQNI